MVRGGGLEPPHHFWRQDLNLVRLPISPSSRNVRRRKSKGRPRSEKIGRPTLPLPVALLLQARILLDFLENRFAF